MLIPAKRLDMPKVVTRDPIPNKSASTTDVREFPGAVANPNTNPNIPNAANVWQYIIAKVLMEAIPLATESTMMGLINGRSEIPPKTILAKVFAPPIIETT